MSRKNKTPLQRHAHDIARRDGGWYCHYCHIKIHMYPELLLKYPKSRQATIDHKIATCNGGSNTFDNMVLACLECNQLKGSRNYDEFYAETAHHRKPARLEYLRTHSRSEKPKNSNHQT